MDVPGIAWEPPAPADEGGRVHFRAKMEQSAGGGKLFAAAGASNNRCLPPVPPPPRK